MTGQMVRRIGTVVALVVGMLALAGSPSTAQESTPGAEQPLTIGDTDVTWSDAWIYDPESSDDDAATFLQYDPATGALMVASYEELSAESEESEQHLLESITTDMLEQEGAESMVEEVGAGSLDDGGEWKLFRFELLDEPMTMLMTASETGEGTYALSTLVANTGDQFAESIVQTQRDILLDGEPAFLDGVDVEQVAALLGIMPPATPESTPAG